MANEIYISFGGFEFDDENKINVSKFEPREDKDIPVTQVPMSDHPISEEANRAPVYIDMAGTIIGTDYDDLRTNIDAFKAAVQGKKKFTLDDDRYVMAQIKGFSCPFTNMRNSAKWKFAVVAGDPFWLSETLHSDSRTPTSGAGYTINNAGNANARVRVRITAPAGGISDNIQIENQSRGTTTKYRGNVAAADILDIDNCVDGDTFAVLNDGTSDKANYEGDFIELQPGNNTIVFTGTAGSTVELTWRDTWIL